MIARNRPPEVILSRAAGVMNSNVEAFRRTLRISKSQEEDRDLLIYLLWETGQYKNLEIADLFGLGYSSVSRRASLLRSKLEKDQKLKNRYEHIKSLIKM